MTGIWLKKQKCLQILFTISDYCAKLFMHFNYGEPGLTVDVTNQFNLPNQWNNQASSVKVTPGYTLELYDNPDRGGQLLNTLTDDNPHLDPNDKASSLSCTPNCKYP